MKLLNDYIAATNTHDYQNLKPLIDVNAVYYFTNATLTQPDDIQAYFETAWTLIEDEVYQATDVVCLHDDATTKVYVYTYNYEGLMDGKQVYGSGRATNVFVFKENHWVLVHEHLSAGKSK